MIKPIPGELKGRPWCVDSGAVKACVGDLSVAFGELAGFTLVVHPSMKGVALQIKQELGWLSILSDHGLAESAYRVMALTFDGTVVSIFNEGC